MKQHDVCMGKKNKCIEVSIFLSFSRMVQCLYGLNPGEAWHHMWVFLQVLWFVSLSEKTLFLKFSSF